MSKYSASALFGMTVIVLVILAAGFSLIWTPYDIYQLDIEARFAPLSLNHWLGADHLGRDILSMLMIGARASIVTAASAILIGMTLGVAIGLSAAASSRAIDEISMRASDIVFAFPALLSAILIAAIFGAGAYTVVIAVAVFNAPVFARLARGSALSLWKSNFVSAARIAGKSRLRISYEHILPNIAPVILAQATIQFSLAILAEAALSYVGLGVQPPTPSWGRMLADAQTYAPLYPRLALAPGLAIFLFVLGVNMAGEGFRHHLRSRNPGTVS